VQPCRFLVPWVSVRVQKINTSIYIEPCAELQRCRLDPVTYLHTVVGDVLFSDWSMPPRPPAANRHHPRADLSTLRWLCIRLYGRGSGQYLCCGRRKDPDRYCGISDHPCGLVGSRAVVQQPCSSGDCIHGSGTLVCPGCNQ